LKVWNFKGEEGFFVDGQFIFFHMGIAWELMTAWNGRIMLGM
jgi:hypothetical protein